MKGVTLVVAILASLDFAGLCCRCSVDFGFMIGSLLLLLTMSVIFEAKNESNWSVDPEDLSVAVLLLTTAS